MRRCGAICFSSGAAALLLQSCGSVHYAAHTMDGNIISLDKSEFTEIRKDQVIQRLFVVVKDAGLPFPICVYNNGDVPTALLMQCTHQGCEVNPNAYSLVCPCHGSEFDTHGKVLNPPAEKSLREFRVSIEGENYLIHLNSLG